MGLTVQESPSIHTVGTGTFTENKNKDAPTLNRKRTTTSNRLKEKNQKTKGTKIQQYTKQLPSILKLLLLPEDDQHRSKRAVMKFTHLQNDCCAD